MPVVFTTKEEFIGRKYVEKPLFVIIVVHCIENNLSIFLACLAVWVSFFVPPLINAREAELFLTGMFENKINLIPTAALYIAKKQNRVFSR